MTTESGRTTTRFRLSQEMITIVTVGVALAGLILVTVDDIREEGQAERAAWQAENQQYRDAARANRAAWLAENQQRRAAWQAEVRQYRDEARSAREAFQREIVRIRKAHAKPAAGASPRPGEQQ